MVELKDKGREFDPGMVPFFLEEIDYEIRTSDSLLFNLLKF